MASNGLPDYVQALLRKRAYAHAVGEIELVQTHISYVFLVDDQVFKLKKAVDLGFLDFTTLEKRRVACEAEVRLNRRACPGDTYIGVERLVRRDGDYFVGGDGETVDYIVHMRRLPRESMMDRILARDELTFAMMTRVVSRLAELHRDADGGPEIAVIGGFEQQLRNWQENLEGIRPFVGRTLSRQRFGRIEAFVQRFVAAEGETLRQRVSDGRVRDCHGDLRSDAVCLDESLPGGVCLYDCIEFNKEFRYTDTGLDAGFLAMDLDYRGRADLSDLFVGLYLQAVDDPELPVVLPLFKCYRATVRGKVESLLAEDTAVPARKRSEAAKRARAYFALAEQYTRRGAGKTVVLVSGPSGSGKSVLAGAVAARLGAVLLSTDLVRRRLFGSGGRDAALDAGIYGDEPRERVYEEIERQAGAALASGRSVVLDGTYIERPRREPVVRLAHDAKAKLLVVECSAPDEVVRERQSVRVGEGWSASEGRWEVYLAQKERIEPATEVTAGERLAIDTTRAIGEQLAAVEARLTASK